MVRWCCSSHSAVRTASCAAGAKAEAKLADDTLDAELELVRSSLLPAESLDVSDSWPREITVTSSDSLYALRIVVNERFPSRDAVALEIKGRDVGRGEGEEWRRWVEGKMDEWDEEGGYVGLRE